jgi:NADPH:quinone reductase-like Zn-dependent oxidoreductase
MKVWTVTEADGAFIEEERPKPEPGSGEVLVRVSASGVNPLDTKIRAGKAAHARHPFPAVLGLDLSGTAEKIGPDVWHLREGDEIYGMAGGVAGVQGSLSEYMIADASLVARKPRNLSMVEAAAMPLAILTAWEGLVDRANVQAGQAVLIHGGAGGVGHMAVQLGVAFGATVHATVSSGKASIVQGYGAIPIDYQAQKPEEYIALSPNAQGWDIVYDTVGDSVLDDSFKVVKRYTGHAISCLGWGNHSLAPLSFRGASYSGVFTLLPLLTGECRDHHGEILARASELAEAGKLRPLLHSKVFSPSELDDAHKTVTRNSLGKIVVQISH